MIIFKAKIPEPSSPQWSWSWGQLPEKQAPKDSLPTHGHKASTHETTTEAVIKAKESSKVSSSSSRLLGSMFNLIGSNSNEGSTSKPMSIANSTAYPGKQDEIYLDETEKLDSEVAALYLNQKSESKAKKPVNLSIQPNKGKRAINHNSILSWLIY